jgi:predicted ATPase
MGKVLLGWARAEQGDRQAGLALMCAGEQQWHDMGAELMRPYYLTLLAETYGKDGQVQKALDTLSAAQAVGEKTGERVWEPELYRLKGELLLQQPQPDKEQVELYFLYAVDLARHRQAKALELRATLSLARLWQQGHRTEAHQRLAAIYGWFTEGFDTADLQDAAALLQQLS